MLGHNSLPVNQDIEPLCAYPGNKIYCYTLLFLAIGNFIIFAFEIQMAAWDRFCMSYHHFIYNYFINPSSFGLTNY